jgi:hypothetical protein
LEKVITIVKVVVVEAVRKVEIPRLLRDFQAEWEPRFWGFPRSGFSTAFGVGRSIFKKLRVRIA